MRKPDFCICEKKDTDQLRGDREADQRLCFRYIDSTIPLLSKSEISSLWPSSVVVQLGLCRTWSETQKTGFLITRLKSYIVITLTNCLYIQMRTTNKMFYSCFLMLLYVKVLKEKRFLSLLKSKHFALTFLH